MEKKNTTDILELGKSRTIKKALKPKDEQILLSCKIVKIKEKGKKKKRILMLTDKAVYNIYSGSIFHKYQI